MIFFTLFRQFPPGDGEDRQLETYVGPINFYVTNYNIPVMLCRICIQNVHNNNMILELDAVL